MPCAEGFHVNERSVATKIATAAGKSTSRLDSAPALDLELCAQAAASCACFNFRKASRAVTQRFDELLQPTGLRSTQLVVLIAVAVSDSPGVATLARALVMDRSTLREIFARW
jgi:hypothetical protein